MGMSQEDIEALMNGLDIPAEETKEPSVEESIEVEKVNTKEIEELLSQSESSEEPKNIAITSEKKINEIENLLIDIEDDSLDEITLDDSAITKASIEEETKAKEDKKNIDKKNEEDEKREEDIVKEWSSSKINQGVFPFPAESDTKVVSQLSQVANDSEEKVSQIFDVLSVALDNNTEVRAKIKNFEEFILSQRNLLNSLNSKFPKISVFNEQLEKVKNFEETIASLKTLLNDEDSQIFQGMELMQFNDINRQKIERVMSVIRKLSLYLNNLFEDDNPKDIPTARHIHGDQDTNDLVGEDLDKLIAEFNK